MFYSIAEPDTVDNKCDHLLKYFCYSHQLYYLFTKLGMISISRGLTIWKGMARTICGTETVTI